MSDTKTTIATLTAESRRLFIEYAKDAGDWGGCPLLGDGGNVEVNAAALRGYLTDWKVKGLAESFSDDGCTFLSFTEAGVEYAASHGVSISRG